MAGKTLADGYVELRADTTQLPKDVRKGIESLNMARQGKEAGESFGAKMADGAKQKISSGLGAGLGVLGIGAGIGGALTSGITGALDVGSANDKLRAQLNLTAADSAKLGKVAGELYSSNYGESMGEVNDAIAQVVRGVPALRNASVPVLKEISAGAMDIARVFDQDVAGVTSAVSTMLKSGLAPNAQAAMDILTKGFQSGANKADDLLDTFTEYSGQFAKLGLDGKESLGVINQLLSGGARSSDLAADAIKEFSIRAIDGSKASAAGYKALNLDADAMTKTIASGGPAAQKAFGTVVERLNAMQDPVKRNAAGVALFGTQWEDLGDAFRRLDVSSVADGMGKVAGATKAIGDQSDSGKLQGFIRTLQTGFVTIVGGQILPRLSAFITANKQAFIDGLGRAREIGEQLLPTIRGLGVFVATRLVPALLATASVVASVVGWFRQHETVTKALAITIGGAVAVVKAYQLGVAIAATATTVWTVAQKAAAVASKAWAAGQWLINVALTANPIGLVVVAIAALVAAIVIAYKNSETFRDVVKAVWAAVKSSIKAVADWFTGTILPSFKKAINDVSAFFSGLARVANIQWQLITGYIRFQWNLIVLIFGAVKQWVTVTVPGFFTSLRDKAKARFGELKTGIADAWASIRDNTFGKLKTFITETIPNAFTTGVAAIGRIWDKLKGLAKAPVRFVVDTVINKAIIGTFNKVSGFFGGPTAPTVSLPSGFGDGHGAGPATPARRDQTGDGLGDILGLVKGPAKWIRGKIGGVLDRLGSDPFAQMLRGMGGKLIGSVIDKAKSLIGGSELGGRGAGEGGLQPAIAGALALLRSIVGRVPLISGFRPGATTLSGNRSYHALGRAMDIAPVYRWASLLHSVFGSRLKELITPWQELNLLNGRPHTYTGAVWNQHNFAGGNAHIHAAMDDGGMRMLRPGYNLIPNFTGGLEPIAGPRAMAAMGGDIHLHFHGPVASKQAAEDMVVAAIDSAKRKRRL